MDSLVSRHIPSLFNGVSQQNPTLRQPSQCQAQVNCYGTVMDGLRKRPPFQHVAQVTQADISTAHVHTINRDVGERYIVIVTDGDLKVYDAVTGEEKVVNFPTGKGYLSIVGGGDANLSFSLDSVADYTFVVNKTVVTATKTTPTVPPTEYPDWFQPGTWGIETVDQFYDAYGAGTLTGTVNVFSELPKPSDPAPPQPGDLWKVVGYDQNNFGGYYVRRTNGVWEESYGPGANIAMNEVSLPHALVREGNGEFTFTPFAWMPRQFGDDETNPPPTFIGRTINGVFYWKNRLGFITDENVVFSRAGAYGNFFRSTLTTLLDSDVVDVAVSSSKVSILEYAVPFNNSMMLFSDQTQMSLNVTDLLTPTSVSIDETTSFEMDRGVRPVSIGSEVYFLSKTGGFSRLREYFVNSESISNDAADVTAHVQRYVPKNITTMAGTSIEDGIFLVSSEPDYQNRIYVYKFFWRGDEKLQSSWSYWEVQPNDVVLSVDVIEDVVYALIKRADGTYLERCDLDSGSVTGALTFDILLDRRYALTGPALVPIANQIVVTLPYDVPADERDDFRIVMTAGAGNVGRLYDLTTVPHTWTSNNVIVIDSTDLENTNPIVGMSYDSTFEFSQQFAYDSNGNADTTGRLQLRTFTVTYSDAGFFQTTVYPYGKSYAGNEENIVPAALDAFTGRLLGEAELVTGEAAFHTGSYKFYIDGNSEDAVVVLSNPSHLQARFLSAQWEGTFTKRSRNM